MYGQDVDYAQIVKTYGTDESKYSTPERKYSPSRITASDKIWIQGQSEAKYVSTSYVERLNASASRTWAAVEPGAVGRAQSGGAGSLSRKIS
ncbi:MAG TPA: hypothetical protein VKB05_12735 [Pyrinomonadaceae bacterium]|nr:hypothetical protein [Pyrinomonadaceae bacterium]